MESSHIGRTACSQCTNFRLLGFQIEYNEGIIAFRYLQIHIPLEDKKKYGTRREVRIHVSRVISLSLQVVRGCQIRRRPVSLREGSCQRRVESWSLQAKLHKICPKEVILCISYNI